MTTRNFEYQANPVCPQTAALGINLILSDLLFECGFFIAGVAVTSGLDGSADSSGLFCSTGWTRQPTGWTSTPEYLTRRDASINSNARTAPEMLWWNLNRALCRRGYSGVLKNAVYRGRRALDPFRPNQGFN